MDRPLTQNIGQQGAPFDLEAYEKKGGYRSVHRALKEMAPAEVIEQVKRARLRGRGGAGFPTGLKWSSVPTGTEARGPVYLAVNADEMEPGTFKDRLLMENDPHLLLEGIIVAGYAVQAQTCYIFLRWAYHLAAERLKAAIAQARAKGYLGANILGTGYRLDVHLHTSAGRYMAGEETGLLNATEGKRATPRSKPPYPPVAGLWGKPTVVNNVETLCSVPAIVNRGADWFLGLSRSADGGTKLYGVSGRVKRPGIWELPLGSTLRELIEEHAGGMKDGYAVRGVLPGGASTPFMLPEHWDVPLDFEQPPKVGGRLGTGTAIVLDDRTCPVGMLHNLESFFAQESCGWCTPCREGLPWVRRMLEALEQGRGQARDLDLLSMHGRFLGPGFTYCALAPGAMDPLTSALRYFREDFERHLSQEKCPWR